MKQLLFVAGAALLLLACKKEEKPHPTGTNNGYPATSDPYGAAFAVYADSLEGTYKGLAMGFEVMHSTPDSLTQDSMTCRVEHIYMNVGIPGDSTVMFLRLTKKFDTASDSSMRVIEMRSPYGGYNYQVNTFETYFFRLNPLEMEIFNAGIYYQGYKQ